MHCVLVISAMQVEHLICFRSCAVTAPSFVVADNLIVDTSTIIWEFGSLIACSTPSGGHLCLGLVRLAIASSWQAVLLQLQLQKGSFNAYRDTNIGRLRAVARWLSGTYSD